MVRTTETTKNFVKFSFGVSLPALKPSSVHWPPFPSSQDFLGLGSQGLMGRAPLAILRTWPVWVFSLVRVSSGIYVHFCKNKNKNQCTLKK